jgi:alanine dehydrogenase
MNVPIISADQVQSNLTMEECIRAMEELSTNEAMSMSKQPKRTVTAIDSDSVVLTMPAFSSSLGLFAVKIVTEFKKNPEKYSLPIQGGLTVLMNSRNSEVIAMLDSPAITALRTGAVSGLATRILSRVNSRSVGLIGSGQQARMMLKAVCLVRRSIKSAKVYSRNQDNSKRFASEMEGELGISIEAVPDRKLATKDADILNVATNSATPVVAWEEIMPDTHINSVGTLPDRRELDLEIVVRSQLFVDTRDGVLSEAGDVLYAINSGHLDVSAIKGDLFELVASSGKFSRTNEPQVTLFKSVGFALQDIYASAHVYRNITGETSDNS